MNTPESASVLRQISLPPRTRDRGGEESRNIRHRGIVDEALPGFSKPEADSALSADVLLPPIVSSPIVMENGGGAIGSGKPVQIIFWGSFWNIATSPSANAVLGAVQSILRGPWMSGLRQYGVRRCTFGGSVVVTNPAPPDVYTASDVKDMVWALIDDNRFPEPDEPGGRNLYMVFMPQGTVYGPGGIRGMHMDATDFDLPADLDHAWVAFVIGNPSLSFLMSTFCHELAEMCTDPEGDAWKVKGASEGLDEIGDVCNAVDQLLNGVTVQSYWSAEDNRCLIPTAYSVRRALKWSGRRLNGKGLRSIQSPIPSLNKLITAL